MPILTPLPVSSMLEVPFVDYLNVTVDVQYAEEVNSRLLPVIESLGFFTEADVGLFHLLDEKLRPTRGTFKFQKRGKVLVISASGGALAALRSYGMFGFYLNEIGSFPHRVSMLHATQDYFVADPGAVVLSVKDAAFSETLALTRKRILKGHVKALLSPGVLSAETGTVYLGNRANADVWAKVYDKQEERLSRGCADPGPVVRVEIAVQSDVGATLKDAFNPSDLFFHFGCKSLVDAPEGFAGWVPSGEGYVLGARFDPLPHDRLDRLVDFSLDLQKLVKVAVSLYGERSARVLGRIVMKRCRTAFNSVGVV